MGSAFVGWAMAQAQADADVGLAGAIAQAGASKAAAAAGSIYSAAVSKAAVDLTRALNAVQTGFVDAATAASLKAMKAIAAAETIERKAVAKAEVVLAQDLQSAWEPRRRTIISVRSWPMAEMRRTRDLIPFRLPARFHFTLNQASASHQIVAWRDRAIAEAVIA